MSEIGGGSDKSEDSSSDSDAGAAAGPSSSPPRVDDSPLQKSMDRNKQCKARAQQDIQDMT